MTEKEQKEIDKNNMALAAEVLELNPTMPAAFKGKFAVMANCAHFARNIMVVVKDAMVQMKDFKVPETCIIRNVLEEKAKTKGRQPLLKRIRSFIFKRKKKKLAKAIKKNKKKSNDLIAKYVMCAAKKNTLAKEE